LLYDGIVVKVDHVGRPETPYRIHFKNWGKRYDLWVKTDQIVKLTEDYLLYKRELEEQYSSHIQKNYRKKNHKER